MRDARHGIARVGRADVAVVENRHLACETRPAGRRARLDAVADVVVRALLRGGDGARPRLAHVALGTPVVVVAGRTVLDRRGVVARVAREAEVAGAGVAVVALGVHLALVHEAPEFDGDQARTLAAVARVGRDADALDLAAGHRIGQGRVADRVGLLLRLAGAVDTLERELIGGEVATGALAGGALVPAGDARPAADGAGGVGVGPAGGEQDNGDRGTTLLQHGLHGLSSLAGTPTWCAAYWPQMGR